MAIAHVCMRCGQDLCRIRAVQEPRYGLAVVVCDRCGWACVRRRRTAEAAAWLEMMRSGRSLVMLALQLVAAMTLVNLCIFTATAVGNETSHLGETWRRIVTEATKPDATVSRVFWRALADPLGVALIWLAVSTASGVWLTAYLGHHPSRAATWLAWAGALLAWWLTLYSLGRILTAAEDRPATAQPGWELVGLGLVTAASFVGIPAGRGLRWLDARRRRAKWSRRRTRLRARRFGT